MSGVTGVASLRVNPDWASLPLFDRTNWMRVRFGDVVLQLKEQVDPASGEVERYVAGEHMDSENIHIQRWGTVGDGYLGPAFIRRFRKGQVLYGSRRTYLKKVAVAEWDGVTAKYYVRSSSGRESAPSGLIALDYVVRTVHATLDPGVEGFNQPVHQLSGYRQVRVQPPAGS